MTQVSRPAIAVLVDLVELTKPRLSGLVVATSAVGLIVAPGPVPLVRGTLMVIGTALLVGAANALNSYLERDIDARMARTASRPLPARRLGPRIALHGGLFGGLAMVALLAVVTNPLTALLGALAFVSYVGMYTPLKQYSSWALPVGAIPGALPPAMGITTVTARFDGLALAMFVLLFVWQLPHFLSISVYLKDEYARAGLKVFAFVHGERAAAVAMALAAALLVPASLFVVAVGAAGLGYAVVATLSGVAFLLLSLRGARAADIPYWSRWVFRASLVHLTVLLAALSASA